MARRKRVSDELYNARRRLRRQAARLRRDAEREASDLMRRQMQSFAAELERAAKTSKDVRTIEQQSAKISELGRIRQRTLRASREEPGTFRSNLIFQQQMNAAGTKGATSSFSEREKDVFWMATKGIWTSGEEVSRDMRYQMILAEFYFNPTGSNQQRFEAWLRSRDINPEDVTGSLQLVFEYVTQELNNPEDYEQPELPYEQLGKVILMVR